MGCISQEQLVAAEECLRQAMLYSDVATLDVLISPDLIFTTHLGQVLNKQEDLDTHRSGLLKLTALTPSEQRVEFNEHYAVVSVLMQLQGSFQGEPFSARVRYTRVWSTIDKVLRIVAGHASVVA